jgi:pimeloyl-ACP methyl ester carboxylesterase
LLALVSINLAIAEEVTIKDQGLTLNARLDMGDGRKSVDEGVILLLHGTLAHNDMEIMRAMSDLLNEMGYTTLAINLSLGIDNRHGMMACDAVETHSHKHTDSLREIGLWIDWLKKKGAKKVVLSGHSRGGNQITWYAKENPDPVIEKVVVVAPATWDWKYEVADYEKRYGNSLEKVLASAKEQVERGNGEEIIRPVGFVYCADSGATAATFVDYYTDRPERNTPSIIDQLSMPVLVFAGSEDEVVKGLIPQTEAKLEPGKVDLIIIEGSDHFFRDLYAEELVEMMVEYIGWE